MSFSSVLGKISKIEKQVLIDLYTSTNGSEWTQSWDLSKQANTWYGITIKNNKVVSIVLIDNNLKGHIPITIARLKNLKVLNLAFNSIHDKIPESITKLSNLQVLRLGKNKISGSIPQNIGDLKQLEVLDLFSNEISGSIPRSLGSAKKLKVISISDNNISGRIPNQIGDLKNLERLELADNNVFGDVPEGIGELSKLQMLVLAQNKLSGDFPATVFSLPHLKVLQLQKNAFDKDGLKNSILIESDLALFDFDDPKESLKKNRAQITQQEKDALIDLYQITKGEEWTKSWDLEKNESTWYGVKIVNNQVVAIDLFRNNVSG
ncbi:putative inactive leucine-rich repeat receptor-like protein kinase [Nymphon striatum]|nr:putative inactive leucine-rich repeat receptor-like protein kinase [Nymphon striatum]